MTPRERVKLAYAHREPDRIPLDFFSTPEFSKALKAHLGIRSDRALLEALGVDFRMSITGRPVAPPEEDMGDGYFRDHWGFIKKKVAYSGGCYTEIVKGPLEDARTPADIEKYHPPKPTDEFDFSVLRDYIRHINPDGRYWVRITGGIYIETSRALRGQEKFLVDLAVNPEMACAVMDKVLYEFSIPITEAILREAGDLVDEVYTGGDIGTQKGPLISPEMWWKYYFPREKLLYGTVKKFGARVLYHSCGSIFPFIEGLKEAGTDILNPLQTSAAGMEPERLKREFGDTLIFNGGMDIQQILRKGSPAEIGREVKKLAGVLGKGGGFVLAPAHNIQVDTPVRNVLAMYEAILGEPIRFEGEDSDDPRDLDRVMAI